MVLPTLPICFRVVTFLRQYIHNRLFNYGIYEKNIQFCDIYSWAYSSFEQLHLMCSDNIAQNATFTYRHIYWLKLNALKRQIQNAKFKIYCGFTVIISYDIIS